MKNKVSVNLDGLKALMAYAYFEEMHTYPHGWIEFLVELPAGGRRACLGHTDHIGHVIEAFSAKDIEAIAAGEFDFDWHQHIDFSSIWKDCQDGLDLYLADAWIRDETRLSYLPSFIVLEASSGRS